MSADNVKCERHPETGYDVAFSKPGSVRFFCAPCADEHRKTVQTEYKGKREAWEYGGENQERDRQRATYGTSDFDMGNDERYKR